MLIFASRSRSPTSRSISQNVRALARERPADRADWDGQPVRFVAQNRKGDRELFRVEFVIADEAIVAEKLAAGLQVDGAATAPTAEDETLADEID